MQRQQTLDLGINMLNSCQKCSIFIVCKGKRKGLANKYGTTQLSSIYLPDLGASTTTRKTIGHTMTRPKTFNIIKFLKIITLCGVEAGFSKSS